MPASWRRIGLGKKLRDLKKGWRLRAAFRELGLQIPDTVLIQNSSLENKQEIIEGFSPSEEEQQMEQHRDVFDEMLAKAFTDISTGFNSIPPPTEVPRLPDNTAAPTMQPTVLGLDAEDDVVTTTAGVPVDIDVLSNDRINGADALPRGR